MPLQESGTVRSTRTKPYLSSRYRVPVLTLCFTLTEPCFTLSFAALVFTVLPPISATIRYVNLSLWFRPPVPALMTNSPVTESK